ncbi:MAG: hypothetical protein IKO49_01100 [Bacilli bacterium]|nr:hypothetical protein [Clostridia bacterium]MBR4617895.1 hypothetical protein [Bacilli bacterium]
MLDFLRKIFKKNTKILKISDVIYSDKKIYCFGDLYQKLGLDKYIEQMKKSNNFNKYHVDNIRCNSKTYTKIMQMFKYNLIKTKNKYSKMYKEPKLHSMIAFDALAFGPSIKDDIEDNYIKVILPGDKNYRNVKKEDIIL